MAVHICPVEGCQVSSGGSCIEGFEDLVECPNYSHIETGEVHNPRDNSVQSDHGKAEADAEVERPALALSSGNALTLEEGHRLTGERMANVVVLMGMVKSGKTTVLAEIYERFCKGPFAGHLFAGSKTIMGFERICFLSRAVSQREREDTDRTKRGIENNLLHLDLLGERTRFRQRLLISDLSGELFEEAAEANEIVLGIPYLRRASHVVVFADAEKLGDAAERHYLLNQVLVLLRCCIEEERLRRDCRVTVAVSRHDLLPCDMDQAFLESMEERIRKRTQDYFEVSVQFLNLAARPSLEPNNAYGLEKLLITWLDEPSPLDATIPNVLHPVGPEAREIDKFALKVLSNER